MVRGNGSACAETGVKATAKPSTARIAMRRGPLRDTLDDLSPVNIVIDFLRFAAVHVIPPGSQPDPFYLLEREAPTHDERGCKEGRGKMSARDAGWGREGAPLCSNRPTPVCRENRADACWPH